MSFSFCDELELKTNINLQLHKQLFLQLFLLTGSCVKRTV